MKVLQINAVYGSGSTGTIVQDIQKCCDISGIECYVAYASSSLKSVPNGYRIGNFFSNKLHALLCRISGRQGYFSFLPTLLFLRWLNSLNPDIVHLHNLHSNFINLNILLRYLARKKIRTIITLHDCWFFTGGCFHYAAIECDKWMKGCGDCPKRLMDTPAYLYDASARIWADRKKYFNAIEQLDIVGVSKWISNEASKGFNCSRRILTIYNGVNRNIFKPTSSDLRIRLQLNEKFVLLGPASKWLSQINKKVLDYFVTNMDKDMVLVLFGVENWDFDLPNNIVQYGFTKDKKELAALYSMADVFVNCSREDTLSFINLEAQSCGTPVVSFSETGIAETVDKKSGYITTGWSEEDLFNGVMSIKRIGRKPIPILDASFGGDYASHYIELYRNSTQI